MELLAIQECNFLQQRDFQFFGRFGVQKVYHNSKDSKCFQCWGCEKLSAQLLPLPSRGGILPLLQGNNSVTILCIIVLVHTSCTHQLIAWLGWFYPLINCCLWFFFKTNFMVPFGDMHTILSVVLLLYYRITSILSFIDN